MTTPRNNIVPASVLRFAYSSLRLCALCAFACAACTLTLAPCLAQDGSPVQAEYTGAPVPAGPNVNEFTGDFTYGLPILTVPGPNGSSYSMTLSYHAGTDPNSEVSWVGYGWSLNPGAILRNQRGFPDDWDGNVIYRNKQPVDYTVSANVFLNAEVGSGDLFDDRYLSTLGVSAGISFTSRYNSNTGYHDIFSLSAGTSFLGTYGGMNFINDDGDGSFEPVLSPNLFMAAAVIAGWDPRPSAANTRENFWANTFKKSVNRALGSGGMPNIFRSRELNLSPPAMLGISGVSDNFGWKFGISVTQGVFVGMDFGDLGNVTKIETVKEKPLHAYGYLRSTATDAGNPGLMDYYYEKDVPYMLDDKLLPIPFSNADVFTISGGGSFRAFNRGVGGFYQNSVSSNIDVNNFEKSIDGGALWGVGARWGDGNIEYAARPWRNPNTPSHQSFTDSGDEPWFFRFSHDMGGSLLFDNDDKPVRAMLIENSGLLGDILDFLRVNDVDRFPLLPSDIRLHLEDWERPGRSGYVGFTLNKDMLLKKNDSYYKAYNRDTSFRGVWVDDREGMPNQIGEFALFGPGKSRYIYGLPVYVKDQKSLSLGLKNIKIDSAANVHHNLLAYRSIDESTAPTVVGQETADPYAVAWLLTEITTPDYVDLTGNGPSDDDLGGWTRFHYARVAGRRNKTDGSDMGWAFWRQPFRGLAYDPGDLSDPEDDMGAYAEGFAERYYLSKIETKTHVALFQLNERNYYTRKDGYAPPPFTGPTRFTGSARLAGDSTATTATYIWTGDPEPNTIRYLDRIELYTKNVDGTPDTLLSTVRFEYDYSLRPNMPNSLPIHPDSLRRFGLLTLRKVWTESMGIKNARIAPVIFGYDYRKSEAYAANVQSRYPEITSFADELDSADENPQYTPYDFDAWGNYRPGGAERLDRHFPWVPQNDTGAWDPAAWQLKWIKTPTGGEIQVQYEQDDYAFVHDRPALAMVSLIEEPGEGFAQKSDDQASTNKYYLRLADIGVDSTVYEDVAKVREQIERLAKKEKKLFFRFFYALKGTDTDFENPEYSSDYIEGYADLKEVEIDVVISGSDTAYIPYVRLVGYESGSTVHEHGVPKRVCLDYVRKRKRGKLGPNQGVQNSNDESDMVDALKMKYIGFEQNDHCKDVDYARSYIRVPMITPKKGGGLRVKRLLVYDPGIEEDSALYGTEYHYEVEDQERNEVISSGVATNEPSAARAENPLVAYMAREEDDKTRGKVMSGRDMARNEGPIGETLLPAASVGYSRVATSPIHQGATTVGFGVKDFHTYRDFPFDARYEGIGSAIDYTGIEPDDFTTLPLLENLIFYRQSEHLAYRTQGYRFVLSDMHGQVRRTLSNGGTYTPLEGNWMTGAMTEYQYYQPGDSIPLLYRVGDSIRYGYPGKVMEIVHAARKNGSYIDDYKIEGDVGFWFLSGMAYYAVNNSELSTHVTTKVVEYPAIVKRMTTYADGDYNTVENVAFDPRSGAPLITRGRDPFHGLGLDQSPSGHVGNYTGYTFPAVAVHPEFDQASGNERAFIGSTDTFEIVKKNLSGRPYLDFPGGSETRWLRKLTPGDLVELRTTDGDNDAGRYHVDEIKGKIVWLLPSDLYNTSSDPALSVTDEVVNVEVVHSGRVNAPGAAIGSVSTYGAVDAAAGTGASFGWSGAGALKRLAFVEQLNDALALGGGTFTAANVDSTLKFKLYISGSCGTLDSLGETFALDTVDNMVLVASPDFTTPAHVDTLMHLGLDGWFALDDAGQVVFRSEGNLPTLHRWRSQPGEEQRVWNFTFCGDEPVYRTVANVIGASASGRMNDTVDYDGGGVASVTNEPNAYEKGERGRWSPRTGYAYKTGVTDGSEPVAGERVYKNAGVFDDFSLFNWREPERSNMARWFRMDSITGINRHNIPYSSVNMLGQSSTTRFAYGADSTFLPILSAWNAEEETVMFESFEPYSDGDLSGEVTDGHAHSGMLSLKVFPTDTTGFFFSVIANQHLLDKGGVLLYWQKGQTSLSVIPNAGTWFPSRQFVRVGEWRLDRIEFTSSFLNAYYDLGDTIILRLANSNTDSVWVDDLKFQPMDAVVAGYAYDKETFRPVATFDDQNFGLYPQYDAEGKAIRSIVETSRGMKTVAEVHAHIPGADRDWLGEGTPFGVGTLSGGGSPSALPQDWGREVPTKAGREGAEFDLLNLNVGLTGQNVTLFGLEPSALRDAVQQKIGKYNALTESQRKLLDRYEELDRRYGELSKAKETAATKEAGEQIENELKEIETARDAILRTLGL